MKTQTTTALLTLQAKPGSYRQKILISLFATLCALTLSFSSKAQCYAGFFAQINGLEVTFYDSTYTPAGHTGTISFGDGTSGTLNMRSKITHTYSSAGTYYVCLIVQDTVSNCSDTFCAYVTVKSCHANFSYSNSHDTTYFLNLSAGNHLTYSWSFGDGTGSNDPNPSHFYWGFGLYYVCLTIYDSVDQCSDTICMNVPADSSDDSCDADFMYYTDGNLVYLFSENPRDTANTTYMWIANGDTLYGTSPSFSVSGPGKYYVCLYVTSDSCSDYECDSIEVDSSYSIGGAIYLTGQYAKYATVYLIEYNSMDTTLTAADTIRVFNWQDTTLMYYTFHQAAPGTYYVKAALDTLDSAYADYLPTYYDTTLLWSNARSVVITNNHSYGHDIYMIPGTNPGGPGFIGGKVTQGANKKEGDPLENIQVTLLSENDIPVAYTYSAADGSYSFDNLALGTYKIFAEIPGIKAIPGLVTITAADPDAKDVEIKVHSKTTTATFIRGFGKDKSTLNITFYPNPVSSTGMLALGSEKPQKATIEIYSVTGKLLTSQEIKLTTGIQQIEVNMEKLSAGIYLLRLVQTGSSRHEVIRVSKID